MGYRSDVAFCLTVDEYDPKDEAKYQTFKKMLGFFKLSEFYRVVTAEHYNCVKGGELGWSWREGAITFCVNGWKWYDGFEAVQAFEDMWNQMQELSNQDIPISGYFMRSGEEMDDNPTDDFGEQPDWDMAYISKVFDFQRTECLGRTESEKGDDAQSATAAGTEAEEAKTSQPEC